ncbi:MAG: hypothetical protein HC881_10510 [Leptolyngbyaceae cyanobacterium SL_7_1]|nr:hypothetical protein [Leptolyngbyaceae cyanobacterium SL_7_1]
MLSSLMVIGSAIVTQGIAVQAESQPTNLEQQVVGSRSRNTSYRGSGRRAVLALTEHCPTQDCA